MRLHIDSLQEKLRSKEQTLEEFEKMFIDHKLSDAKYRSRIQVLEKKNTNMTTQIDKLKETIENKEKAIDGIQK